MVLPSSIERFQLFRYCLSPFPIHIFPYAFSFPLQNLPTNSFAHFHKAVGTRTYEQQSLFATVCTPFCRSRRQRIEWVSPKKTRIWPKAHSVETAWMVWALAVQPQILIAMATLHASLGINMFPFICAFAPTRSCFMLLLKYRIVVYEFVRNFSGEP